MGRQVHFLALIFLMLHLSSCSSKSESNDSPPTSKPLEKLDTKDYPAELWISGGWIVAMSTASDGVEFIVRAYFNEIARKVGITMECKPSSGESIFASAEVPARFIGKDNTGQFADKTVNGTPYATRRVQFLEDRTTEIISPEGKKCKVSISQAELELRQIGSTMEIIGLTKVTRFTRLY